MPPSARHLLTRVWVEVSGGGSSVGSSVNVDELVVGQE